MARHIDITPEQHEKLIDCKTPEEILALAKAEGYELSDEELEDVSGGWGTTVKTAVREALKCPGCGSYEVLRFPQPGVPGVVNCRCVACGHAWITIGGVLHS